MSKTEMKQKKFILGSENTYEIMLRSHHENC